MKRNADARNPKLFKVEGSVISTDIRLRDLIPYLLPLVGRGPALLCPDCHRWTYAGCRS